jgi:precorrin-6B C5,15-methyltransferase / cobalt-precorrin-6B C5,C15-methyltransferase
MSALPLVHVVGVGLSGAASLTPSLLKIVESATILVGAQRHLDAFGYLQGDRAAWPLGDFTQVFANLRSRLKEEPKTRAVILASGDPLFFGLGRLLLDSFPAEQLVFHPQVSAVQLAFSRLKLPWQDAMLVSVHGRDEQLLIAALKRGDHKIAVLTDTVLTPEAIAKLITALDLPVHYQMWVCENLGGADESLSLHWPRQWRSQTFAALNVVVLLRQLEELAGPIDGPIDGPLPLIGLPDAAFKSFPDRPTLITKREIRLLILAELAPLDGQTIWDIGAGTGSVSVEVSRLYPKTVLYAIEKTAIGAALIRHNAERLAHAPIQVIQGQAPSALTGLPRPDRAFIGGSSRQLLPILDFLNAQMIISASRIVLALTTLENLSEVTAWIGQATIAASWRSQMMQVNISRSVAVGSLTRFLPLSPITLITLHRL